MQSGLKRLSSRLDDARSILFVVEVCPITEDRDFQVKLKKPPNLGGSEAFRILTASAVSIFI